DDFLDIGVHPRVDQRSSVSKINRSALASWATPMSADAVQMIADDFLDIGVHPRVDQRSSVSKINRSALATGQFDADARRCRADNRR
ncbi:MAG: hypothetical protein N2439_07015, partial [Anaerolineae bacterium]|nr:hypothetical protein [Anaerolineae bacterium]